MKLTVIGSGTGIIRKKRRAPCFLLEAGGQKLLFDCGYDQNLIKLAKKTNLLLIECSVPAKIYQKHGPQTNHLAPQEVGQIAQKASAKKVILFHLYDLEPEAAVKKEIAKNYSGEAAIPHDGQKIML